MRGKINKIVMTMLLVFCMSISISAVNVHAEDSDSTVKADNHEKVWKEYEAERAAEYLAGENTYPKLEGYLFSGWYTKNEIPTDDNAALEFVIKDSVPDGATTVYALFVPEHMLSVKAQVSSHLIDSNVTSDDDTASIRFVTTVDSLLYQQVGFEVSYVDDNGNTKTATSASNKVYERLFAQGSTSDVWSVTPQGLFCGVAKYFKACTVTGVPTNNYSTKFTVKPYWITMDGAKVYGVTATKAIEDGCLRDDVYVSANGQNVPYHGYSSDKPYATLNYALSHVNDGGTVHITDNVEVGTWEEHGKNVTITGGKLTVTANDFCINDGVTFKSLELIMPDTDRNINRIFAEGHDLIIESSVTVTNTEATFQIFGGSMTKEVASTNMKLYAGSYNAIFGGGCNTSTNVLGDVSVTVGGKVNENVGTTYTDSKTTTYQMFGGGYKGVVYGDVKIVVEEGALFNYIYGGMCSESGDTISKVNGAINIVFAGKAYGIYCGSYYGTNGNTCLNMTGGEAYQIFGGNRFTDMEGNTDIQITKGTVHRRIFGGSYNNWSITWESPSRHVTGYTSVTIGEDATLNLNQGDEYGLVAGSRSGSTFDDETGVLIFNDNTYSTHEKKIGSSAFSFMKKYHYLVKSSTGGKVYSVGNCIQIEPTSGNTAVVTVKKSDGTEEVVYYTEDTKSYYPLPDLSSYTGEVIVTFGTGKVTDFSGYAASIGTSYYKTLEEAITAAEKDENAVIKELTTTKQLASITIADSENGTVTADKMNCVAGDKVTLTVTPDEGYELANLSVTKDGAAVEVASDYSFTTVAGTYTVEAEFALKKFNGTVNISCTSDNMSFDGVALAFTLKSDSSIQYTGTVDSNGQITLNDVLLGTYEVSSIDVLGGTMTFSDVTITDGITEVNVNNSVGIHESFDSEVLKVNAATSTVNFKGTSVSNFKSNGFYILQGQKLSGNVWFGAKVQMSETDLTTSKDAYVGLLIYVKGEGASDAWNLIQVRSNGDGTASVGFNNNYTYTISGDLVTALVEDGILLAANRAEDGVLTIYGGVHPNEMEVWKTVTESSSPTTNMKTADLDQFGTITQGSITDASVENITSGTSMSDVLSGFNGEKRDVTVTINSKSNRMSFEGVELTFTLKRDNAFKRTVTFDANGQVVLSKIPNGTYTVSSIDFLGGVLTFDDVLIWEGRNAITIEHNEGITDAIQGDTVQVNVATSSVTITNYTDTNRDNGRFFVNDQTLSGNQWFGMKVKMSQTDMTEKDGYPYIAWSTQVGGWNFVQVMNNNGNGVGVVKYNNNQKELSVGLDNYASALTADGLLLALNRTENGELHVWVGSNANEMKELFVITSTTSTTLNLKDSVLDHFGVLIHANSSGADIKSASIENITSGASMAEVLTQDVTVTVNSKSENVSFEGTELTFTSKKDSDITRTVTVDENNQVVLSKIPIGTYTVSSVDFFGGTLTFPDITIQKGMTKTEITHNEGINDSIGSASAQVNVAESSVSFVNSSAFTNRSDGYFFLQGQKLSGDVWFGMKVKMSEADLSTSGNPFVALCIYENGWNLIQVMSVGDGTAVVKFNYNHQALLTGELATALTGDGLLLAVNRAADGTLRVYGGATADEMQILTTVTKTSNPTTNMQTADLDQFGFMTQGNIADASIENIASGSTIEELGFEIAKENVAVTVTGKSTRMSFKNVELTFTLKADSSVTYQGTADENGIINITDMLLGTYTVSDIDFLGGKLTFPDVEVQKDTTSLEIKHNENVVDNIEADINTVRVDVATSSVYVNNYTGTDRNKGTFYLHDQTLSGDVWFGMRVKMSSTDMTEKDGYPYIAWNSYVGNNWNFVQVQNNNGNGIGAMKYNNNYVTAIPSDITSALTSEEGMLLLLHRTADGTMEVYASVDANPDNITKMFTVNATASTGKPALNLGTNTLENFGFLIRGMTGGSQAPDIKSASIENMTSGTSQEDVLGKLAN